MISSNENAEHILNSSISMILKSFPSAILNEIIWQLLSLLTDMLFVEMSSRDLEW